MDVQTMIKDLMGKSREALKVLEGYNQEQIDAICKAACLAFKDKALEFSKEVVEETGLGHPEHKIIKNVSTPDGVWGAIKGKRSVGVIGEDKEKGLMYIGQPKGVVVVVAPTTNPNITVLCNAIFAIKGRNTCIVCSHPRAKKTTQHTVDVMNAAMEALGAPKNIIQVVPEISVEITQAFMKAADVIIATGGMGMVKSAYSSGVPAYGVGAGNVQTLFDRDYDYTGAVPETIAGRAFDNGMVCACNQSAIIPREKFNEVIELFRANKAYIVESEEEKDKIRKAVFPDGKHNPNVVGQFPQVVAKIAGISIPDDTSIIVVKGESNQVGPLELLCGEKMCPVLIAIPYDTWEDGIRITKSNLFYSGAGHSAVVYSNNKDNIAKMAVQMPVCRLLVNQAGQAAANAFGNNGLSSTTSLGCGSWGNNSIDENLTYKHLINISRVAWVIPGFTPPSEKDLWG